MSGLISVIIPVYKVEKYIDRCLDSVINQTYENLEIILIDDGSPDNCGIICDEYAHKDSRIKVIHKENGGVSSARNAGLDKATGDYIGFVDPDDYIDPDMYSHLYNNLNKYDADVSVCSFLQVTVDGKHLCENHTKNFINVHDNITGIKNICTSTMYEGHLCNKLFKSDLLSDKRFDTSIKVLEDSLICIQAFLNARKIVYDSCKLYNYVRHEEGVCSGGFTDAKFTAYRAFEQMRIMVEDKHSELLRYINYNELKYGVHLLGLMYNKKISNKNHYMKLISSSMRRAYMNQSVSLAQSKTVILCCLMNFINVRLTNIVFGLKALKSHIKRNETK